ncbi:MAG: hypothetical protein IT324_33725 [Anaerolineae bacterium]|nr:hypothetical protein [Anaerolineae bacterium]
MTDKPFPTTLQEAVTIVLEELSDEDKNALKHVAPDDLHGLGLWGLKGWVKQRFRLWESPQSDDVALLMSDIGRWHPDNAAASIVEAAWKQLQDSNEH